jgi:hypothetical protein
MDASRLNTPWFQTYPIVSEPRMVVVPSKCLSLLATKIQTPRLSDVNSCDGFCMVADWLGSRVLCVLGGLSLADPAR